MKQTSRKIAKEEKLNELLAIASRHLKRGGLRATSIDDVMTEAKLTRGSFYAYFKSKDDMILQALHWMIEKSHEQVRTRVRGAGVREDKCFRPFSNSI